MSELQIEISSWISILFPVKTLPLLLTVAALVLPFTGSLADDRLDTLKSIYSGEMDKIVAQYMQDMSAVQQAYSANLDAKLKQATNEGNLDGYTKMAAEKKRFENEKTIPPKSAVQSLVDQVDRKKNIAVLNLSNKYLLGLNSHKIALMKAGDIEGAKAVQEEVDSIAVIIADRAKDLPVSPKPQPKGTAAVTSSDKMKPGKPAAITVNWHNTEFLVGNSAYTNYKYLLTETPKELNGYFFIQQVKRKETAVEFEVTDSGVAYCFHKTAPDDEWKETGGSVGINYNGKVAKFNVYKKTLNKGIYNLPKGAWLIFPKK